MNRIRKPLAILIVCLTLLALSGLVPCRAQSVDLDALKQQLYTTRLYREGYPKGKTRQKLIQNYRDDSVLENCVAVRSALERVLIDTPIPGALSDEARSSATLRLQETVNEILSGQLQLGNQWLLAAGRRKFPSQISPDQTAVQTPFNERNTWKELALAGLEFEAGILEGFHVLCSLREDQLYKNLGSGLFLKSMPQLRTRGGTEIIGTPAEGFATYTIIDQPDFVKTQSHFIRTEMNLFIELLNRRGLASTALVDRLRRLAYWENNEMDGRQRQGDAADTKREDLNKRAMSQAKRDAQLLFYGGLAARAAMPYDPSANNDDFKLNQADKLFAHLNNLNREFKDIRDGLKPTGLGDAFIPSPNKRIGGSQGYLADAAAAVTRALTSQTDAENKLKEVQQSEVMIADRNRSIRETYLTQLGTKTGFLVNNSTAMIIDPFTQTQSFDLKTPQSRKAFLALLDEKIAAASAMLDQDAATAQTYVQKLGEIGIALVDQQQASVNVQLANEKINNIGQSIQIADEKTDAANAAVTQSGQAKTFVALEMDAAQASYDTAVASGKGPEGKASIPGIWASAAFKAHAQIADMMIDQAENTTLRNIDNVAQVKELLLGVNSAKMEINLQALNGVQAANKLELLRREVSDLVENLASYRDETANLYYLDPSLPVENDAKELQAGQDLQDCLASLFDLTHAMEFYWTEKFQNPVETIDGGIVTLPNFANDFTEIDDLYAIDDAKDAEKYLNAIGFTTQRASSGGWDSVLRGLRQSIPATGQTVVLSLREDILGFTVPESSVDQIPGSPTFGQVVQIHKNGQIISGMENLYSFYENQSITKFRDWLQAGRKSAADFAFGTGRDPQDFMDGFEVTFSTNEKSNYFFDAREWNTRIESIAIDMRTEGGFIPPGQEENFVKLNVVQEGTISFPRSFPLELSDKQSDTYKVDFNYQHDRLRVSPFEFLVQASVNGSSGQFGGQAVALPYFFSPVCSQWRLVLDPLASLANNYVDLDRIKDIRIVLTLRSGIPPTVDQNL